MSWDKELEELRHRERLAEQMGGEEKVARVLNPPRDPEAHKYGD